MTSKNIMISKDIVTNKDMNTSTFVCIVQVHASDIVPIVLKGVH